MKNFTLCERIKSFYWDIINFFLKIRYNIKSKNVNFDDLYSDIFKDWEEINGDLLKDINNWNITREDNWGSTSSNSISVASPKNIIFDNNNNLNIINKTEPNGIRGRDWDGKLVTKYYSSGEITTKELFSIKEKRFSLWCDLIPSGKSTWPAFWVFYIDENSREEKKYFEIDGFEKFPNYGNKLTFTVHWGLSSKRKMYNKSIKYKGDLSYLNCIAVTNGRIKVYINNILVFKTSLGYPKENYNVCCKITDSVNDDSGRIDHNEINNELPIYFHSKNLIIWKKRN